MDNQQEVWVNRYLKNIKINSQLDFSKYFYISFNEMNNCTLEMYKYQYMSQIDGISCIVFYVDKRKPLFQNLQDNQKVTMMHYFPLSKEKYLIKAQLQVLQDYKQRQQIWEKFSIEQKENYLSKKPNLIKDKQTDQYNIQERQKVSNNFQILQLFPEEIFQTIMQMPQVYADSRNPVFESEFKPYKKNKKLHIKQIDNKWIIKEINPQLHLVNI